MWAKLTVQTPADYGKWTKTGGDRPKEIPLVELGKTVFVERSCAVCHATGTDVLYGPGLKGVSGSSVRLSDGRTLVADENYLRESILIPHAKIVMGFPDMMPAFAGTLTEREVLGLIAYLKSLN